MRSAATPCASARSLAARGYRARTSTSRLVDPETAAETPPVCRVRASDARRATSSCTSSPPPRPWPPGWPRAPRPWSSTTTTSRRPSTTRRGTTPWPATSSGPSSELRLLAGRAALAVAVSAFNETELRGSRLRHAPSGHPPGGLPSVPHSAAVADACRDRGPSVAQGATLARVGRVPPNKAIEDAPCRARWWPARTVTPTPRLQIVGRTSVARRTPGAAPLRGRAGPARRRPLYRRA